MKCGALESSQEILGYLRGLHDAQEALRRYPPEEARAWIERVEHAITRLYAAKRRGKA